MVTTRSKSNLTTPVTAVTNANATKINTINTSSSHTKIKDRVISKSASAKPAKPAETVVERRITRSCSRTQQPKQQEQASKNKNNRNGNGKNGQQSVQEGQEIVQQVQPKSPEKLTRNERRRNEALLELKTLGKVSSLVLSGQRRRKQAEHQDAAFVLASLKQSKDAGRKGGLVRGSRHHYERSY